MAKLTGLRAKFKPADTSKHHIPTFVVMTCLYIALGLLGWLVPQANYFGIFELAFFMEGGFGTIIANLLRSAFGIYLIVLPTYFLFLSACSPFHMAKGLSITFLVIGLVLNAGTIALAILLGTLGSGIFFYVELVISELGLILGYLLFAKGLRPFWYVLICIVFTLLLSAVGLLAFAAALLALIGYFLYVLFAGGKMSAKVIAGDSEFVRSYKDSYHYIKTGERAAPHYRYSATVTNGMGCSETVYSDDKRTWYSESGALRGTSNDDGRTINLR